MAPLSTPALIAERAVALATGSDADMTKAQATLINLAGDAAVPLEQARDLLVRRIRQRSDDFSASSGLSLLNATLSTVGKLDDLEWQPRKWRLPR